MAHEFKKVKGDFFDTRCLELLKMLCILKSPMAFPKCSHHKGPLFTSSLAHYLVSLTFGAPGLEHKKCRNQEDITE